jgi:hypothetical protein
MAKILETKFLNQDKINVKIDMSYEEFKFLKGSLEKIHVFSEDILLQESRLVQRGKREFTKYFLLPKNKRKDARPTNNVMTNVIETEKSLIYIFQISKI